MKQLSIQHICNVIQVIISNSSDKSIHNYSTQMEQFNKGVINLKVCVLESTVENAESEHRCESDPRSGDFFHTA